MLFKPAAALLALTVIASAAPQITNSCNTGAIQCCEQVHSVNSPQGGVLAQTAQVLAGFLGVNLGPILGSIAANCVAATGIGAGSGVNCVQQPLCCSDNQFHGLIAIGCSPININF